MTMVNFQIAPHGVDLASTSLEVSEWTESRFAELNKTKCGLSDLQKLSDETKVDHNMQLIDEQEARMICHCSDAVDETRNQLKKKLADIDAQISHG